LLALKETTRFRRDIRRMQKRGKSFERYKEIILLLVHEKPLPPAFREHRLSGDWADFHEGHIEPDWLLIYRRTAEALILVRTGTHGDLFG